MELHLNPVVSKTVSTEWRGHLQTSLKHRETIKTTYCTWSLDPLAFHQDEMTLEWTRITTYALPPIALIPRVLLKLEKSPRCRMILIAPHWPHQMWFPRLILMLVGKPLILPMRRNLIRTLEGAHLPRQTIQIIKLTAWPISSDPVLYRTFSVSCRDCRRGKETGNSKDL